VGSSGSSGSAGCCDFRESHRSVWHARVGALTSGVRSQGALLPNPDAVHVLERQVPARMERAVAIPSREPTASRWSARNLGEAP
jgi:hypothetical protein